MGASAFHIIILAVAVAGIFRGWRKGFIGQAGTILGMLAGIVFCRLFARDGVAVLEEMMPSVSGLFAGEFIYMSLSATGIYIVVYVGFKLLAAMFSHVLGAVRLGAVNSLAGSVFCLLKYMVAVSLAYNLILALFPGSALMRECKAGDGNMVETVTALAPALFGTFSPSELALKCQLRDAADISCNISARPCVIPMPGVRDPRFQSYQRYATSKRFACRNQRQGDS